MMKEINDLWLKSSGIPRKYFMNKSIIEERNINIDIILGKYKAISAYKIPDDLDDWLNCPNCLLKPITWRFDNGCSTACGCGENEYRHFSIHTESIMSYVTRNSGSSLNYNNDKLRSNWNHWVETGEVLESFEDLRNLGRW